LIEIIEMKISEEKNQAREIDMHVLGFWLVVGQRPRLAIELSGALG